MVGDPTRAAGAAEVAFRNIGELTGDLGKVTAPSTGAEQPQPTRVQIVSGADTIVAIASPAGATERRHKVRTKERFHCAQKRAVEQPAALSGRVGRPDRFFLDNLFTLG